MDDCCDEHSGHAVRLAEHDRQLLALWGSVNRMQAWVIAGMTGLLAQCVFYIITHIAPAVVK